MVGDSASSRRINSSTPECLLCHSGLTSTALLSLPARQVFMQMEAGRDEYYLMSERRRKWRRGLHPTPRV
ncbi:hypothetical protein M758_11G099300 [Ceratodon purpureus]|nr:hypothetical protein M758_11G099300 [Ceratodon purpureus]